MLISGCDLTRPPVYIPPEYRSPPPADTYSNRKVAPEPAPQAVEPQGPVIASAPGFKKQDLPTQPAAAEPSQPVPQGPGATSSQPMTGRQQEQSPQLLASMQLVNQAKAPLDRGKPDTAIPILEKAIQLEVQNPEAYMLLARAWRQKGARQKALEFAKKAEILYQDEPARLKEVFLLKADLYKELGDHAKSEQYRKKAANLH
jgi:tetratricopeptide (TPR) repeat protein